MRWWKWLLFLALPLFVPVPTQMVPEWRIQFRDENGNSAAGRVVEQSWRSYTYWGANGYDQKCTNTDGVVTFPKRYLWSGLLARAVFPVFASALTIAHGSEGTDASVRLFDRHYISKDYYWRDDMSLYTHRPDGVPPSEGIAEPREPSSDLPTCETIH